MKQIINRWTLVVMFTAPNATTMREAVLAAVEARAVLSGAVLSGADLSGADLSGADLSGADLRNAVLRNAVLSGADLSGADLRNAVLRNAVLSGADLRNAVLRNADLSGADLRNAVLSGADLQPIRDDLYKVIEVVPNEVPALIVSLRIGRVDGSTYEGSCACLVGTVANVKRCRYDSIVGLSPTPGRPAERWFLGIRAGDTPANNQVAKITEGWLLDWVKEHSPKAAEAIAADDAAATFLDKFNADRLAMASALSTTEAP